MFSAAAFPSSSVLNNAAAFPHSGPTSASTSSLNTATEFTVEDRMVLRLVYLQQKALQVQLEALMLGDARFSELLQPLSAAPSMVSTGTQTVSTPTTPTATPSPVQLKAAQDLSQDNHLPDPPVRDVQKPCAPMCEEKQEPVASPAEGRRSPTPSVALTAPHSNSSTPNANFKRVEATEINAQLLNGEQLAAGVSSQHATPLRRGDLGALGTNPLLSSSSQRTSARRSSSVLSSNCGRSPLSEKVAAAGGIGMSEAVWTTPFEELRNGDGEKSSATAAALWHNASSLAPRKILFAPPGGAQEGIVGRAETSHRIPGYRGKGDGERDHEVSFTGFMSDVSYDTQEYLKRNALLC